MLVHGRLILSISASIVRLASERLNLLPRNVIALCLTALGHPTLEKSMIALRGFLGSKIFRSCRTMTDLDTGITSVASIARIIAFACKRTVIVIVVDDNGLTDDLFQSLVVIASLSTPLDELLETSWLDLFASALPVAKRAKECIIISVCVSNPCDDGKLHATRERNVLSTANTFGVFLPGTGNDLLKVVLRNPWKQLLDRSTNLFRGFFVALYPIIIKTHLCKGLGDNTVVLLLLQIGSCDEGTFVRDITQSFASFFDYLAAEVIPNAMNVMRHFGWISSILAYRCGLFVEVS